MTRKRKRNGAEPQAQAAGKRSKTSNGVESQIQHPVLELYFKNVTTLRECIFARFPASSYSRKQRLRTLPSWSSFENDMDSSILSENVAECKTKSSMRNMDRSSQIELAKLLDTIVVAWNGPASQSSIAATSTASVPNQNIRRLSQNLRSTVKSSSGQSTVTQSEIVDFAVGHLINTVYRNARFPAHVLCTGFSRSSSDFGFSDQWSNGLYCTFQNCNAMVLQSGAWPILLKLLGKDGDQVMLDLIFHCAMFSPVSSGKNNLSQLSGVQLSELPLLDDTPMLDTQPVRLIPPPVSVKRAVQILNKPSQIKILRNKMFYARAGLNAKGSVRMGLQHIHVFNRYADHSNPQHVVHVMNYIFPRQFGLHNVFTCKPDRRETVQYQRDYTMREQEIGFALKDAQRKHKAITVERAHVPRRLRKPMMQIVGTILRRHSQCAYVELLRHYCRVEPIDQLDSGPPLAEDKSTTKANTAMSSTTHSNDIVDLATPAAQVYAFCRAALLRIFPAGLFDIEGMSSNFNVVLDSVKDFVYARKRENLDLHSIVQRLKLTAIQWLETPSSKGQHKLSLSESSKRIDLLMELLYYIFDSYLIPLIRSNFHVTESNVHTHQLFYFRHDVWRRLTEPYLHTLKTAMFQDHTNSKKSKLADLSTPYGHMRWVPKGATFRPIMNLKRKPMIYENGRTILGPRSVNMMLKPVYSMLKHEKLRQPEELGASMFSVDEVYPRIKRLKQHLQKTSQANKQLYFAKVDVTSCFDTIPQEEVLELMQKLCDQEVYCSTRHAELSARQRTVTKRFKDREPARSMEDHRAFSEHIALSHGQRKNNTVFIEQGAPTAIDRHRLMRLLKDHIMSNKVKLGKKFMTQKRGIPQGSILSTILCNFFYGSFEAECLGFVKGDDSLLLRLLDDFLLITLDHNVATRFLREMHAGSAKYGITIKPQKSMANFPHSVSGYEVNQCPSTAFPYCGKTIDTNTLEISRDRDRQMTSRISESLTIERTKSRGEAFYRLSLDAMKRQLHAQYTDADLNSMTTIYLNVYQDFLWAAVRMHAYIHGLGPAKVPVPALIMKTIDDLAAMTFSILTSKTKLKEDTGYVCRLTSGEVTWLLMKAFRHVLLRKQSMYTEVISWLENRIEDSKPKKHVLLKKLNEAILGADATVR